MNSEQQENQSQNTVQLVGKRLTVVHLNDDCLENVFSYLSPVELTNVAESNVHLAIMAKNVIAHNYRNKPFNFNFYDKSSMSFVSFGQFLKHFGKYLVKLCITFGGNCEQMNEMFDSIVKNCRKTLIELTLNGIDDNIKLDKPFLNLKKLQLIKCYFGIHHSLISINDWFPNLICLKVYDVGNFWKNDIFIKHFPNLQSFGQQRCHFRTNINNSDVIKLARFVSLNPQLKCLELDELNENNSSHWYVPFENENLTHLPNIERLEIVSPFLLPNQPIIFDDLKDLKLSIYNAESDIIFKQLPKSLEYIQLNMRKLNASAIEYLLSCENLKKLKIITMALDSKMLKKLAKPLQSLCEIHFILKNCLSQQNDFQTLCELDDFFILSKQLKIICFKYELSTFDVKSQDCIQQIVNAKKFINSINETMNDTKWLLNHEIHNDYDDFRTSQLSTYPHIQLSFNKINIYYKK